jgi:hypothetical protein
MVLKLLLLLKMARMSFLLLQIPLTSKDKTSNGYMVSMLKLINNSMPMSDKLVVFKRVILSKILRKVPYQMLRLMTITKFTLNFLILYVPQTLLMKKSQEASAQMMVQQRLTHIQFPHE